MVQAAHRHGKLAIAYTTQRAGYSRAMYAGYDVITMVPIDGILDDDIVDGLAARGVACIPTLCMMQALVSSMLQEGRVGILASNADFKPAMTNVKKLYDAKVRICAGTEANRESRIPIAIGESLHKELELLVEAGLSNLDSLRAATTVPATVFGLADRGVHLPGHRADIIMIEGNPLENITATKNIRKVWIGGHEVVELNAC